MPALKYQYPACHDCDGLWSNLRCLCPSAEGCKLPMAKMTQQSFSHLGAGSIVAAEK
jgi:hypothetical protein